MRLEGRSDDEIVQLVKQKNLFQYPTQTNLARTVRVCLRRLDALVQPGLVMIVAHGTQDQAAQTNLYAMMCVYPLMAAFMTEVVGQRFTSFDLTLTRTDVNAFFTRYCAANSRAAAWSASTVARIKSTLSNCLTRAGFLASSTSTELLPVALDADLKRGMLANGDERFLPAFNCLEAGL